VTADGRLDLAALERALAALARNAGGDAGLRHAGQQRDRGCSTGIAGCRAGAGGGALLHVDAVQGAGRIPFNINELGADLLTISGHKIGGPKGAGALVKRQQALHFTDPLIKGGGQERGARAGTENVACIVGFGAAAAEARLALAAESARMAALRDRLEAGLEGAHAGRDRIRGASAAASQYDLFAAPASRPRPP